jgi:hypothetical protein
MAIRWAGIDLSQEESRTTASQDDRLDFDQIAEDFPRKDIIHSAMKHRPAVADVGAMNRRVSPGRP